MSNIQEDRILRIHSPGYGTNGCLKEGSANPLDSYDVMIINPLSIIHLFESNDSELIEQINLASSQGLTNFNLSSDVILTDITKQLGKRIFELIEFLKKGGLLIYYLCRPFIVQSPSRNLDNYVWLNVLAPDMGAQDESEIESPETTARHMSAISHGRNIDITDEGMQSDFVKYFQQQGLEWNTIIRENFLTEGYNCLAVAGSQKCISAYLVAGNNGGSIIFLPAPYSPDFDKVLIDCVNNWFNKRNNLFNQNQTTVEKANQPSSVKTETAPASENVVLNQTQNEYSVPNNQVLNSNVTISQNPSNYQPDNSEPIDYTNNTDTSISNLANQQNQYQESDLNKTDGDVSAEKTNSLASRFERLKSNRISSSSLINKDKNPKTTTTENPLSSISQDSYNTNTYTVPDSVKQEFIASPNSIIQEIDTVISSTNTNLNMSLNDPTVKSFNPKDFNSVLPLANPDEANNLINSLESEQPLNSDILNDTNFDSEFMLNAENSSFTQTESPAKDTTASHQNLEPVSALTPGQNPTASHQNLEPLSALTPGQNPTASHQNLEPVSALTPGQNPTASHQNLEPVSALTPGQNPTASHQNLEPVSALTPGQNPTASHQNLEPVSALTPGQNPTASHQNLEPLSALTPGQNPTASHQNLEPVSALTPGQNPSASHQNLEPVSALTPGQDPTASHQNLEPVSALTPGQNPSASHQNLEPVSALTPGQDPTTSHQNLEPVSALTPGQNPSASHQNLEPVSALTPGQNPTASHQNLEPVSALTPGQNPTASHQNLEPVSALTPGQNTTASHQNLEPVSALTPVNDTITSHQNLEPVSALTPGQNTTASHQNLEPVSALTPVNDTITSHQNLEPLSALAPVNDTFTSNQAYTSEILYPTTSALSPENITPADFHQEAINPLNSTPNDTVHTPSPNQTDNELSAEKILNDEILKPIINNNFTIANQTEQEQVKNQSIENNPSNEAIINDLMQQNQLSIAKFKEQQKINSETKQDSADLNFNGLQELDSTLTSISQSNQQEINSSTDWQIQLPPQGINSQNIKVEPSQSPDINFDFDLDIDLDFNIESPEEFSNLNIPTPVNDNNLQPQSFVSTDQVELKLPESDFKPDSSNTNFEEPTVTTNQTNAIHLSNNKQGDLTMNNNNENTNLTNLDKLTPSNPDPSTVNLTNEWIGHIIFPEITTIIDERTKLNHQINQIKNQISSLDNQLALYENIRNCLLCSHENELYNAVKMVFKRLNWSIQNNPQNNLENEFLLSEANKIFGLVRIAQSNSEIKRTEFASLAESVINYWNNTEIEPKGILVVSTWTNRPLSERMDPEFSTTLEEFATKKGICVITTAQLLSIFLSVDTKKINHSDVNNTYLNCNGKLPGFNLNYTDSHKIPASVK